MKKVNGTNYNAKQTDQLLKQRQSTECEEREMF